MRAAGGTTENTRNIEPCRGLPDSVERGWRPRPDAWASGPPSAYAGRPARPLFVGGCPRSGTTLLQVMLDMHPQLGIPRETNFIRQLWWQRTRFGDLADPANRRRAARWILGDRDHHTWRLDGDGALPAATLSATTLSAATWRTATLAAAA